METCNCTEETGTAGEPTARVFRRRRTCVQAKAYLKRKLRGGSFASCSSVVVSTNVR